MTGWKPSFSWMLANEGCTLCQHAAAMSYPLRCYGLQENTARSRRSSSWPAGQSLFSQSRSSSMKRTHYAGRNHSRPRSGRMRRRERASLRLRYRVALCSDLRPGESRKFLLPVRGIEEECFLINYQGQFHAYLNRCRHVPMAMDWVDNQFFAEEGHYLMCQTHNAYYLPDSGECIAGPAGTCGKFLYRVPVEIDHGIIYASPPDEKFEDGA
jgi:nitrite reductase/ring-hydroxylating ferredoxin subunit